MDAAQQRGGDQRVAISAVHPEALPPGASSPGNHPTFIQFSGTRVAANMASPRTITIVALSFALGLFFVFMGTIKLTPRLSKDAYSEMVSTFLTMHQRGVKGHCSALAAERL